MKKIVLGLMLFAGSFSFAGENVNPKKGDQKEISISEINEVLKVHNLSISNVKYNDDKTVCGFTMYVNDGVTSYSWWFDCSDPYWSGSGNSSNLLDWILDYYFGL
jgi:hypothetical protein